MTRCSVLYSRCTKYKRFHLLFVFSLLGMLLMLLGVMCEDENDAATNENNENINKDNSIPSLSTESNNIDNENIPARKIKFGETVKLDELGPVIVQSDCTLKRIENWHTLTEGEREATMRRIGGRNRVRLEHCKEQIQISDAGEL